MAEPTLSLTVTNFQASVGLFLGYGRGVDSGEAPWTPRQLDAIVEIVQSGIRQFYFPPAIPGERGSYDWSFLKPTGQFTLAAGQSVVTLPDDFGGIEGQVSAGQGGGGGFRPIRVVGEELIRHRYAAVNSPSGRPDLVAVRPAKATAIDAGQRSELYVYPIADGDYTLEVPYYVLPDLLTTDLPYALGGPAHVETILESCLAIAEERLDDSMAVHKAKFMERLAASISFDRRLKPQLVGYNGDRSDGRGWNWRDGYHTSGITYNGVQP